MGPIYTATYFGALLCPFPPGLSLRLVWVDSRAPRMMARHDVTLCCFVATPYHSTVNLLVTIALTLPVLVATS